MFLLKDIILDMIDNIFKIIDNQVNYLEYLLEKFEKINMLRIEFIIIIYSIIFNYSYSKFKDTLKISDIILEIPIQNKLFFFY